MQHTGAWVLLASVIFCQMGCSPFIANSGVSLDELSTRSEVIDRFGAPRVVEMNDQGTQEIYGTRRKISSPVTASGYGMELVMLFGLMEPRNLLQELAVNTRVAIFGRKIEFSYDKTDKITGYDSRESWIRYPLLSFLDTLGSNN